MNEEGQQSPEQGPQTRSTDRRHIRRAEGVGCLGRVIGAALALKLGDVAELKVMHTLRCAIAKRCIVRRHVRPAIKLSRHRREMKRNEEGDARDPRANQSRRPVVEAFLDVLHPKPTNDSILEHRFDFGFKRGGSKHV